MSIHFIVIYRNEEANWFILRLKIACIKTEGLRSFFLLLVIFEHSSSSELFKRGKLILFKLKAEEVIHHLREPILLTRLPLGLGDMREHIFPHHFNDTNRSVRHVCFRNCLERS